MILKRQKRFARNSDVERRVGDGKLPILNEFVGFFWCGWVPRIRVDLKG